MKFLLFFLLIPLQILSQDHFSSAFKYFKRGVYQDAIIELNKIQSTEKKVLSTKHYFLGISYARLQNYDEAVKNLETALSLKNDSKDIYYELGQAYYAKNDLHKAKNFFLQSVDQGYKKFICHYYIGYIYQIFDDYEQAKVFYRKAVNSKETDIRTRQVSLYQLGHVSYSSSQQNKDIVSKEVIPLFKKSINTDKSNVSFIKDVEKEIADLQKKYNLNTGVISDAKRWSGRFEKKFTYDDNITLKNDLPSVIPSKEDSFVSQVKLYGQYNYNINNRFVITPNLRLQYIHHFERDIAEVYQNDTYLINPAISNVYKTTVFNQPSDIYFLYNFKHIERDRLRQKKKVFYARSHQYSLGQKINIFKFGSTDFKVKYKHYDAFSESHNNQTYTLSVNQALFLPNKTIFIIFHQSDLINFKNDFYSSNNFILRLDWIIPNANNTRNFHLYHSFGLLDTKKQKPIRGNEELFTVGVKFTQKLAHGMSLRPSYSFSKKLSKDHLYKYEKHNISLNFKATF